MSCPNKLVNAKSKNHFERTNGRTDERTDGRTDGVTWSLLELLIAAKNQTIYTDWVEETDSVDFEGFEIE